MLRLLTTVTLAAALVTATALTPATADNDAAPDPAAVPAPAPIGTALFPRMVAWDAAYMERALSTLGAPLLELHGPVPDP